MEPHVACIMPTYNRPDLIQEAIYSIFNQTYSSWSLHIRHDGPFVREYNIPTDDRIYFSSHKKRTASPATLRNHLLEEVLSLSFDVNHICFLDDDDMFSFDYMEKMVTALENSNADCVYCGRSYYNDGFYRGNYKNSVFHPIEVVNEILPAGKTGYLAMPDVMAKAHVFKDPQIRFHGRTWQFGCEDINLFSKMYLAGYTFTCLPEYLVKVRWHNSEEPNHSVLRGNNKFERLGDLRV